MAITKPTARMTEGPLEVLTEARRPEGARELTEVDLALLADMCGSVPTVSDDRECLSIRIHLPPVTSHAARLMASRLLRSALALIGATSWQDAAIAAVPVASATLPIVVRGLTT